MYCRVSTSIFFFGTKMNKNQMWDPYKKVKSNVSVLRQKQRGEGKGEEKIMSDEVYLTKMLHL